MFGAIGDAIGSAWDWTKGAVEDVWDATSGKTDFRAKAYDPANVQAAQQPWLDRLAVAAGASPEAQYAQALSGEAAGLNQSSIYQHMADRISGYDPNRSAGQLEGVAGRYGSELSRQAAGLERLAGEVARAPSYADAASRAAMDRASSEATARAASARGPNAALAMRDAAGMSAGASRQAASEAAALSAQEMNQRFQTRGDLLSRAAGVSGSAGQLQGSLYGAAGDQRRTGMQASVDSAGRLSGEQRSDMQARSQAHQAGGALALQGQQQRQSAAEAGLQGATQGQGIIAGSHDSTNATNANVQTANAKNQKDTIGGLTSSLGMAMGGVSDIRAKQDIATVSPQRQDYLDVYQPELRDLPADWGPSKAPRVGGKQEQAGDGGFGAILKALGAGLSGGSLSDERSKRDIDPIVKMAVSPEGNRDALAPVKPYRYRYRDEIARAAGLDTEPRMGVMAQDLERSDAGAEVVNDGPGLKTLDNKRALSFAMAGVAGLDKRLRLLERASGGRAA